MGALFFLFGNLYQLCTGGATNPVWPVFVYILELKGFPQVVECATCRRRQKRKFLGRKRLKEFIFSINQVEVTIFKPVLSRRSIISVPTSSKAAVLSV
jgi:hypothetical protein